MSDLRIYHWHDAPEVYRAAFDESFDFVAWAPKKVSVRLRWEDQVRVRLPEKGGQLVAGNRRVADAST